MPKSVAVELPYDLASASFHDTRTGGGFDDSGRQLPAEMIPAEVSFAGVRFKLAPAGNGKSNALVPRGQTINLPSGRFTRLYVLAASADDDQMATFTMGDKPVDLVIQHWGGFIGQWDDRQWVPKEVSVSPDPITKKPRTRIDPYGEMVGIKPGFIKRAPVAWFASHHHNANGTNEAYGYSYLFANSIDLPVGTTRLKLPDNDKLRILAITVSDEAGQVVPAHPLYDTLEPVPR
jgi:alpha-mannosidase